MKKLSVLFFCAIGLFWCFNLSAQNNPFSNSDLLKYIEEEFAKKLPSKIDEFTVLYEVKTHESVIEKRYKLLNLIKEEVEIPVFYEVMTSHFIELSCANKQSLRMYKRGIEEWHTYSDKNGEIIGTIKLNGNSCK